MRKTYVFLNICSIALIMAGCENYDKAIQGIEQGREFIVDAEKKVVETRKEAEKVWQIFLEKIPPSLMIKDLMNRKVREEEEKRIKKRSKVRQDIPVFH